MLVALLGAAPAVFGAPAGIRPAGPSASTPYGGILPSGRILSPAGTSVVTGMNTLGVTLSPDGRYAITTNDDEREATAQSAIDGRIRGGFSITVVDTVSMRVSDFYPAQSGEGFFLGIAALRDPRNPAATIVLASDGPANVVRVFDLSPSGKLSPEPVKISLPLATDQRFANRGHAFPGSLAISADGRVAYVVNNLANTVSALNLVSRQPMETAHVGFFPYGVAISGGRVLVTNEGLMNYGVLPAPVAAPNFANAVTSNNASSLSIVPTSANGDLIAELSAVGLPMDTAVDADQVGGAHPTAILATKNGRYAYVTMTNVDRIATVALDGTPRVLGGLQLRLFDRAPYGTQPDAMVLSKSGKLLYVALAGINAVAVLDARDPVHLHRAGLIPTGWYPTALALSADGRYLFVANAKGYGQDRGFEGAQPFATGANGRIEGVSLDSNDIWATLERIDLQHLRLASTTAGALRYLRSPQPAVANSLVPPLRTLTPSAAIKHVVFILEENKTYDSMLGDLTDAGGAPYGAGDPSLVSFGASVTPNLHALAREFGLAVNEYADADESDAGHQIAAGGIASAYSEKTLLVKNGRRPLVNKNEDPEDYPRAGYIFNSLFRGGLTYHDYGDLVRLSGYDEGAAENAKADDPAFVNAADTAAPTQGLGGLYALDVPAPLALRDRVDLNYPGWNLRIRDVRRAQEFIRDYGAYVKADTIPQYTYVWLPADHGGAGRNIPALPEEVADGDRALGMIVDYLTHLPSWSSTAIFITPDDAQSTRDHINEHRSYAIAVSPFAKRHYLGKQHLSTISILKTEEELLGLPPLSLGDLLATDMADFFTANADARPFQKIEVPTQTASPQGQRIADLLQRTDQSGPDADVRRSARIIELSRAADRLAARRNAYTPAAYQSAERALDAAALHVVGE